MLQIIRDKAQGIVIWIIVGLIILALSSFILNSYLGSSAKNYVAKVNDQEISDREFRMALNNYQQQLRQMLGENFGKIYNEQIARQKIISDLISGSLMQQLTDAAGFRTSNTRIALAVENNSAFKQDGKFSNTVYEQTLARVGYTPARYEHEISQSQAERQFVDGISQSVFVLKSEAEAFLQLSQEQRDIGYLLVNMADVRKGISVSDAEIKQYYDAHLADFMTVEQVQVAYLELSMQDLAKTVTVDDAELKSYYKDHEASYTKEDFDSAKKKIDEVAAKIKKGEAFDKLAKEYSQDLGSAVKGGDLGFFSRNMMVKPFEEAAFELKVGQVSKPVRTQYGYHLIKLDAIRHQGNKEERKVSHILIKPSKVTESFEAAKAQVREAVQMKHAERLFYQDADKLDRLTYEHQDSLEPAAEQLKLKILESPFFSRQGGAQIWRSPDVIKAAFSEDVLKGGLNSELIKLSDDHMLVLRLKEHKPASQLPLDAVKQRIVDVLKNQLASQKSMALADKLVKDVQAGATPNKLADDNPAVGWFNAGYVGRDPQNDADKTAKVRIPDEIRKQLFLMRKPDKQPVIASNALGNGDAAVIVFRAVREPAKQDDQTKQLEAVQQQLVQAEAKAQTGLLLEYERANSKIDINNQQEGDAEQ